MFLCLSPLFSVFQLWNYTKIIIRLRLSEYCRLIHNIHLTFRRIWIVKYLVSDVCPQRFSSETARIWAIFISFMRFDRATRPSTPESAPKVAFDAMYEQIKHVNKTSLALGRPAPPYSRKHLECYSTTYSALFRLQIATAQRPNHDQMENLL